ncbi:hypothetical protein Tco_0070149, partial [Tanacetum coccineum]
KRGQDTKILQSSGPPIKVGDEAVHKELGDKMERAASTAYSFTAEQDSDAQTRFEAASKKSNDPPLLRVNTLGSGEDISAARHIFILLDEVTTIRLQVSTARPNLVLLVGPNYGINGIGYQIVRQGCGCGRRLETDKEDL